MKTSSESCDARLFIVGAPGSGSLDLLRVAARRWGGDTPEALMAGRWETLRTQVVVGGTRVELFCLTESGGYSGILAGLLESADAVLVLFDVSPHQIGGSRAVFDGLLPKLKDGDQSLAVQYHRTDREPRFDPEKMDAWLGLSGSKIIRISTESAAPEEHFEELISGLVPEIVG